MNSQSWFLYSCTYIEWHHTNDNCDVDFTDSIQSGNVSWIATCDKDYPSQRCYKDYEDTFQMANRGNINLLWGSVLDDVYNEAWALADLVITVTAPTVSPTKSPSEKVSLPLGEDVD